MPRKFLHTGDALRISDLNFFTFSPYQSLFYKARNSYTFSVSSDDSMGSKTDANAFPSLCLYPFLRSLEKIKSDVKSPDENVNVSTLMTFSVLTWKFSGFGLELSDLEKFKISRLRNSWFRHFDLEKIYAISMQLNLDFQSVRNRTPESWVSMSSIKGGNGYQGLWIVVFRMRKSLKEKYREKILRTSGREFSNSKNPIQIFKILNFGVSSIRR